MCITQIADQILSLSKTKSPKSWWAVACKDVTPTTLKTDGSVQSIGFYSQYESMCALLQTAPYSKLGRRKPTQWKDDSIKCTKEGVRASLVFIRGTSLSQAMNRLTFSFLHTWRVVECKLGDRSEAYTKQHINDGGEVLIRIEQKKNHKCI